MPVRCHFYAVEADQIEPMKSHPALVLGRAILAGLPSCHMENSVDALEELLRDGGRAGRDGVGYLGRREIQLVESTEASPHCRLLVPQDVKAFENALRYLNEAELFRRFNRMAILAAGVDAFELLEASWEKGNEREDVDALWCGDWTIDQAEEFESLAQDLEKLRPFIRETAHQGRGVVIVER